MDLIACFELLKALLKSYKLIFWCFKKIPYGFNYLCRRPYNVLIYGCSGAGKTEFLRALLEQPVQEQPVPRTQSTNSQKLVFPDGRKIRFYDLPGHSVHKGNRHKYSEWIAKNKIKGIINVVTYGYNNVSENDANNIFNDGEIPQVKEGFLNDNRNAELSQVNEWLDFIHTGCGVETIVTIVTKADLWEGQKNDVLNYYERGDYHQKLTQSIERVCHTAIFPYCSLISLFGDRPTKLVFDERNKCKLHRELKEGLLRIIRHDYQ